MKRYALIFVCTFVFYSLITHFLYGSIFLSTTTSYYSLLTDAFLHGRANLLTDKIYDLSIFEGKTYMYWGLAPVFFILPFRLFGIQSDVFYTLVAGSLNAVLIYMLLREVIPYFRLKLSRKIIFGLVLAFVCVSPNFYLSLDGRVWHTNQIISITYILSYLIFLFHYIRTSSLPSFVGALIFFNLACLTRLNLGLYGMFLLFPFINAHMRKKPILKLFIATIVVCGLFASIYFTYNFIRFGNIFEVGYRYHRGNERFMSAVAENKILSLDYVEHNVRYYFGETLPIMLEKPFVRISPEGNSIFSVYPYTLLLLAIPFVFNKILRRMKKYQRIIFIQMLIAAASLMMFLLMFYATGWVQFGNRYFFDLIPLVFMLLLFILPFVPGAIFYSLVGYGMIVNLMGAIAFYQHILP